MFSQDACYFVFFIGVLQPCLHMIWHTQESIPERHIESQAGSKCQRLTVLFQGMWPQHSESNIVCATRVDESALIRQQDEPPIWPVITLGYIGVFFLGLIVIYFLQQERHKWSLHLLLHPLLPRSTFLWSDLDLQDRAKAPNKDSHSESHTHTHTSVLMCDWGQRNA